MNAATSTLRPRPVIVDPVDYLLVDFATGRHLPGDAVHAEQLAHEHGLTSEQACEAIDAAWRLGFAAKAPCSSSVIVTWTPEATQRQLHRLARAMVSAVVGSGSARPIVRSVIDGEPSRIDVVELFGLATPSDVELFVELGRALLGGSAPHLVDEVAVPLTVLLSQAAQTAHGMEFAAPASVRRELVVELVSSLIDGRVDDFCDTIADYVVSLSID